MSESNFQKAAFDRVAEELRQATRAHLQPMIDAAFEEVLGRAGGVMPDMSDVVRIEMQLYGARNFPAGSAVIPESLIADYQFLFESARRRFPHYTHEAFMRYMFVKGIDAARMALRKDALPNPDNTPKCVVFPLLTEPLG